ncbi:unnamed protein product [Ectocarpus sp. 13 AM-2016]
MEVLMDERKTWTETSEEAQVLDEPATQSTGTQTSDSAMMPDDGSSRNSQSLGKTEETTSSPSTGNPEIESDMPVSIYYILGYAALSVLLALCGLVASDSRAFLKVGSRVFATPRKRSSLSCEARRLNTIPGRPHGVANGALGDLPGNPRGGAGRSDHLCPECHGAIVERGEGGAETRYDDHVHLILPTSTLK